MTAGVAISERNKPPYRVVYESLRKSAETAGPGVLIPPRAKLARQFNVAEGTISRAIGLLKDKGFAYGQQGKGTYICECRPKSAKIQQIGFLSPGFERDIISCSRGFNRIFHEDENYTVLAYTSQMSLRKYRDIIENIADSGLSGIILSSIASLDGVKDGIDISHLAESGVPVVLMGSPWPGLHCDRVLHSRRDSARKMAARAVAGGCRNPGVFLEHGGGCDNGNEDFLDELAYTFGSHGIEIKQENIFMLELSHIWVENPDPFIDSYNFTKKELARVAGCDSLMFHSDGAAIGALRALREGGIEVPEQIKILSGYRSEGPESAQEEPTAVDGRPEEQARLAAKILKRRIEGYEGPAEVHYVAGEFVEGKTT